MVKLIPEYKLELFLYSASGIAYNKIRNIIKIFFTH